MVEVLRTGYRVPLSSPPQLSPVLIALPSYSPSLPKGVALREEVVALLAKGAIEPASLFPPPLPFWFFCSLFGGETRWSPSI